METLLEEAKTCAEQRFFGLLQSLAGGGVPGLRPGDLGERRGRDLGMGQKSIQDWTAGSLGFHRVLAMLGIPIFDPQPFVVRGDILRRMCWGWRGGEWNVSELVCRGVSWACLIT